MAPQPIRPLSNIGGFLDGTFLEHFWRVETYSSTCSMVIADGPGPVCAEADIKRSPVTTSDLYRRIHAEYLRFAALRIFTDIVAFIFPQANSLLRRSAELRLGRDCLLCGVTTGWLNCKLIIAKATGGVAINHRSRYFEMLHIVGHNDGSDPILAVVSS